MLRLLISLPVLLLVGCGGGSSSPTSTKTGHLLFHGANGMTYETQSQVGETSNTGDFQYHDGETVSFSVGNVPVFSDIPAKEFITFVEDSETTRSRLNSGDIIENLSVHRLAEQELIQNDRIINITRFLISMDEDAEVSGSNNLEFTERNIEQLNSALEKLVPEGTNLLEFINFDAEKNAFGSVDSNINKILAEICFFPEESIECQSPPTQDEIDNAPVKPSNICEEGETPEDSQTESESSEESPDTNTGDEGSSEDVTDVDTDTTNGDTIIDETETGTEGETETEPETEPKEPCVELDPDIEYKDDLENKKGRIESGIRTIGNISDTAYEDFLTDELSQIGAELANRYYLTPYAIRLQANDRSNQKVNIQSFFSTFSIEKMEVLSLNEEIAQVLRFDPYTKEVEFFVTGASEEETELVINFKVEGDYRWIRKTIRVILL